MNQTGFTFSFYGEIFDFCFDVIYQCFTYFWFLFSCVGAWGLYVAFVCVLIFCRFILMPFFGHGLNLGQDKVKKNRFNNQVQNRAGGNDGD